jgi:hypothetical protein
MKYVCVTRHQDEPGLCTVDIGLVMVSCMSHIVAGRKVIRYGSLESLVAFTPVRKVTSKQSPELGLMHMKQFSLRFEAIHASMVSGPESQSPCRLCDEYRCQCSV